MLTSMARFSYQLPGVLRVILSYWNINFMLRLKRKLKKLNKNPIESSLSFGGEENNFVCEKHIQITTLNKSSFVFCFSFVFGNLPSDVLKKFRWKITLPPLFNGVTFSEKIRTAFWHNAGLSCWSVH